MDVAYGKGWREGKKGNVYVIMYVVWKGAVICDRDA